MTIVTVDISNIASTTYPDDKIIFQSPVFRGRNGGGMTSTAPEPLELTDGIGNIDLEPGPVIVTFQCRGVTDTRPKRGTVPDVGPIDLFDVISKSITYTPEVVAAAQAARYDAIAAAARAKASEDVAGGHAEDAGNASNAASGYAQEAKGYRDAAAEHAQTATDQASVATDKAGEANASSNTAGAHASAADTARQGAVAAQGLAETARDEAETKVQDALDVALPTKADKEHEHTTAQVTGLDAALAGKAAQTTLDTRVPAGLALRLDTTVGTRIFAGTTMIHGDTGWRNISTLTEGIDFLRITRIGNRVSIVGGGVRVATGGTYLTKVLPAGFIPGGTLGTRGFMVIKSAIYPVGNVSVQNRLNYQSPPYASSVAVGDQVTFEASWITPDPWPVTLPGVPA